MQCAVKLENKTKKRQKGARFLLFVFFIVANTSVFVRSDTDAGLLAVKVQLIPAEFDRVPVIILCSQDYIYSPTVSQALWFCV